MILYRPEKVMLFNKKIRKTLRNYGFGHHFPVTSKLQNTRIIKYAHLSEWFKKSSIY